MGLKLMQLYFNVHKPGYVIKLDCSLIYMHVLIDTMLILNFNH